MLQVDVFTYVDILTHPVSLLLYLERIAGVQVKTEYPHISLISMLLQVS